jgi:alkylhydroperoxidase family enzyme
MRLPPLGDDQWPEEIADMLDGFAGGLNVYRTMAHHPDLLRAWAMLREHVVNRTSLGRERAEVVILRTGLRLGSGYEWSQHVLRARQFGLSDRRIAGMRGAPEEMEPEDALLARAVDQLFADAALSGETLSALKGLVGPAGVLDLMTTVGFYSTLGFILNSFDTPLDADAAAALAERPLED